jgi:peptidoglycan hydrolase-like protein with peptidoglycan-binding domain
MRTEEENDSSKGNNEMSTNPFIKGFLKLQERVGPRPGTGDAASNPVTDRTGNSSPSTTPYRPNTLAMNPRGAGTGYSMNTGEPVRIENKPKVSNLPPSPAKLNVSPDRDRRASPIAPAGTTTSNLRVGSSGNEVKRAQEALGITADGSYGPQTRQAVIDFQKKNNLKADGIIGDQTLSMMNRQKDLGESEMSTNPYIKGFFDIEEARAKNTNIFDESKKLTAAQKKNLDKNDNDKIDAEDFEMLRKEESDLDEAKKTNSMVMARNISKVLKAAKPDFLDIDKDGDKEESMKKAAADKKKESDLDEAVTDEHRERALATINARISKPGQPPKHPTYDGAPADIKTAVDNLAKMYAESVDLDEAAKAQTLSALTGKASPIDDYADMIAKFKAKGGSVTKVASKLDDKEKAKLSATFKKTGGKGGSAMATGEFASMNKRDAKYNAKQANARKKSMGMKEGVEFSEEEIDFINNVMEAMPVAPTSENDSPNPTPKNKAEGSRAKGSMAD